MTLVINLLGASGSKIQIVVPHGTVSAMVLVTGGHSVILGFAPLSRNSPSQAYSGLVCWLRPVFVNVPGLHPLLQRSLAWGWSCKGLWLYSTPSEVPESGVPRPAEDLPQAYSLRGPRLMPRPIEVSDSCLLPWRSHTHTWTHKGPGSDLLPQKSQTHAQIHAQTHRGIGSGIVPWRSQTHAQTLRGPG